MNQFDIIQDIVLILLVALPIIYIFKKINMPAIVGFLISGIIIGPYGFALMKNPDGIEVMAEIGVILLLFTIGLEVSFTQLIKIRKFLLIAGGIQVAGTILIAALILSSIGLSSGTSIFIGMLVPFEYSNCIKNPFRKAGTASSARENIPWYFDFSRFDNCPDVPFTSYFRRN